MSEKRRDKRNRILREGEYQRADGRYRYRYIDEVGKEKWVYSWRLDKNDPTPRGTEVEFTNDFTNDTGTHTRKYGKI